MAASVLYHVTEFISQCVSGASKNDKMTEQQLRRLSQHKYSAIDSSILDDLIMQKFWCWLVESYPLWLAPNLITLVGLILNIMSVLILSWYCPDGVQVAPWWTYLFCAVALFVYQALDATDGKQARRTKSSSPLGELFDHGCDSLSQIFVTLESCLSLRLGDYPNVVVVACLYSVFLFYCAHWQTYVSGTLRFQRFDVTEAQFVIITVCVISAFFGSPFWSVKILGMEIRWAVMAFSMALAILQFFSYIAVVFTGGVGKNGSTVADTSVLFPMIPVLLAVVPGLVIYVREDSTVFEENVVLYCITFGLITAKVTNRLIIAHMSKSELIAWDTVNWAWVLLVAVQYFMNFKTPYFVLIGVLIYSALNLICFCCTVCNQIADFFKIRIFIIPHVRNKD